MSLENRKLNLKSVSYGTQEKGDTLDMHPKYSAEDMFPKHSAEDIAGPFFGHYCLFWKKLDFHNTGKVILEEAVSFLTQSGLSKEILNEIWQVSNPKGKYLLAP